MRAYGPTLLTPTAISFALLRFGLAGGQVAFVNHCIDQRLRLPPHAIRLERWIDDAGRADRAGKFGGLKQGDLRIISDAPAVVMTRGGFDSIDAVAEINVVEIHGHDLIFRENGAQIDRQEKFLELALRGFVAAEKQRLGELHCNRRPAR